MHNHRFDQSNFGFGGSFGRLIQDAFEGLEDLGHLISRSVPGSSTPNGRPRADVFEEDGAFVVAVELPGVSREELKLELVDGALNLSADVTRETASGRKNFSVARTLSLPDAVGDGAEITAKLADGILTIHIPKPDEVKPRTITIE